MQVRHNTTLLERAIEHIVQRASIPVMQAQADALERTNRAFATRRIATGFAIAVVAVGLGLGIKLALDRSAIAIRDAATDENVVIFRESAKPQPKTTPKVEPRELPQQPNNNSPIPAKKLPTTVDFTKFTRRVVTASGKKWEITAGHHFEFEEAQSWQRAWCYTNTQVEGVSIRVELAERPAPEKNPIAPQASTKTLKAAGLTPLEAFALAAKCAWLDREFSIAEITPAANLKNPLDPESLKTNLTNRVLYVSGVIGSDFTKTIGKFDFDVLEIDSVGGLLDEALAAGRFLRAKGKDVRAGDSCFSACVFVLAGGNYRHAKPGSKVGVHRFRGTRSSADDLEIAQQKSSELIAYLTEMGVAVDLFHAAAAVPSDEISVLSLDDMLRWKLLTGVRSTSQELPKVQAVTIPSVADPKGRVEARSRSGWSVTYSTDVLAVVPDIDDRFDEKLKTFDTAWRSVKDGDAVAVFMQVSMNRRCGDAKKYVDEQLLPRRKQILRSQELNSDPTRSSYVIEGLGQKALSDDREFFDWVAIRRDDPSTIVHFGGRFPAERADIYRGELLQMLNSLVLPDRDPFTAACLG